MALDEGLTDWVAEAMAPLGAVTRRRMMGGATFYLDGTVFAIVTGDGRLWFKADGESDAQWDAIGAERFSYAREGRVATMNYRLAPEDVYDDADALRQWGALGLEAGQRAPARKPRRKR